MEGENPFTVLLESFLSECADLQHSAAFAEMNRKATLARIKKNLTSVHRVEGSPSIGMGTALPVAYPRQRGGWIQSFPAKVRRTADEQLHELANEQAGRFNASLMVTLHETFEEFAEAAYAQLLFMLNDETAFDRRGGFEKPPRSNGLAFRSLAYCQAYAEYRCGYDCEPAMDAFDCHLDWSIISVEKWEKFLGCSFREYVSVIGYCRHLTVHKGGRLPRRVDSGKRQRDWPAAERVAKTSVHGGLLTILPDIEQTYKFIEYTATYVCGLYEMLTTRFSLQNEHEWLSKHTVD